MMDGSGSLMWGMGWGGLLVLVVLIVGVAALMKYVFLNGNR